MGKKADTHHILSKPTQETDRYDGAWRGGRPRRRVITTPGTATDLRTSPAATNMNAVEMEATTGIETARALVQLGLTSAAAASQHDADGHVAGKERRQDGRSRAPPQGSRRAWRAPELPKEDVGKILRPKNGLELRRCSQAVLKDGVRCTAKINTEEAEEDTLRINPLRNPQQSCPLWEKIDQIMIGDQAHGINAYTTPPEGSAKGVIHNIPGTDSDEDITRSLQQAKSDDITGTEARDRSESSSRLPLHDVADDNGGATKGGHISRSNQRTGERGGQPLEPQVSTACSSHRKGKQDIAARRRDEVRGASTGAWMESRGRLQRPQSQQPK
ncbi:hypothetical protein HPB47_002466 [Ixodes persulcatus]|uniref:Uncharacterized protein n=1 Tax=Ixodes persulcatus TaxID=34615 RepID=A0AC60PMB6_IXOPE|nr:hypothetical protein HPB47_002466 [Ixodes persulcatus]